MARRYGHTLQMRQQRGIPHEFVWRGVTYRVREILATWHLRDHWWVGRDEAEAAPASDRHYYRLTCTAGLQCDVYYDAARALWVLDRVHD